MSYFDFTMDISEDERKGNTEAVNNFQEKRGGVLVTDFAGSGRQPRDEFVLFAGEIEREGKITPGMRPAIVDFMEIFSTIGVAEFNGGANKRIAQPLAMFKNFLKGLPYIQQSSVEQIARGIASASPKQEAYGSAEFSAEQTQTEEERVISGIASASPNTSGNIKTLTKKEI